MNKSTRERMIRAQQAVDEAVGKQPTVELAMDALRRYQEIAEGAAGLFRPKVKPDGEVDIKDPAWRDFGDWLDRAIYCAKELANYQSPKLKALAVLQPPGQPLMGPKDITLKAKDVTPETAQAAYRLLCRGGKAA